MQPVARAPAAAPSLSLQAAFQRHLGIADAPQVEAPPLPPASSRAGQAASAVPLGAHVDPTAIHTFQASKGLPPRPDSISARLTELEADAERTAATRTAQGAYFGSSSASDRDRSHRSRLENLSVTAPFALASAPQTDASSLFNPAPHYRDKVALGGHAGGQKHAMRGNALRANLDPARIDAAPAAAASGAAAAPAALSGVPLSFFGVSTDLTRGQSRIQQRWLTNLGVSDVAPRKDGPLSPRKPMGDAAAKRASRPSSAVGAVGFADVSAEPEQQPQGAVVIPPLHIPVHPWQPSMQASKPDAMHLHAVLPPQHFEIPLHPDHVPHHLHYSALNQPAPPAPSAVTSYRPASGRSSRPTSSTSRSQRAQQQVSAAAAAAASAAGSISSRPASAAAASSLGASKSRPSTANRKALSSRPITDARGDSTVQPTFIPGAADASAFSLNIRGSNAGLSEPVASHLVQRPSTVDSQRAASQQTQQQPQSSNQYRSSQSSYINDEKDDDDGAIPFEQEYARFLAREQASALAGAQTSRPASSAAARPAPATARPMSGRGSGTAIRSRPASGSSTARRSSQDPLLSSFYSGTNNSRQAAATAASLALYSGGPSALVRVSDRGLTNDVHFADRQNGLLLTTRARPPFMTGTRNDGHSAVPLHSAALKPNAGFQTELGVSAQLLGDFILQAQSELPHFYSRHLFWDYRLTEMLRATEADMVSEVAGNTMAGSGTRSNIIAAAGGGGGGSETSRTVDSSSDHVYPSTYRIMAASYILQQVVPMLHTPHPDTQTNTKSQEAANAAAQAPNTRALLRIALDVLHRSIYQPAPVAASTARAGPSSQNDLARQMAALAPHDDLSADHLFTGTQGEAPLMSRRAKQIAAVQSSGYGQSNTDDAANSELRDDLRQADRAFEHAIRSEAQMSLLHAQARSIGSGLSTPLTSAAAPLASAAAAPSHAIPYFLAVRYLYEGTQSFLLGSEKLSAKLAHVDASIDRIFARSARRLVTLAFKAWLGRVRTHRQKLNLSGFLTRKSRTQSAKRNPHLIFAMWKRFAARQAIKRRYRRELGQMNAEIKTIAARVSRTHTSDREALLESMSSIQSSFVALEAGGKFRSTPVDIFSPLMLHLVLERYAEQIELVDALSAACVDLLPLAEQFSKARCVAVEVDMVVDELGSLSSSAQLANLAEIQAHLRAKLEGLVRAESAQEDAMMESLLYLSAEDFLFKWVNCHLTESRAGRTLEDLAQLISGASAAAAGKGGAGASIYLELLKSVAPAVVDTVGKDFRGAATAGSSGPPSSSSAASTADFETRAIAHARWVLGVAAELGCTPVISMAEFLAHPNHAGVLARWKSQEEARVSNGGARVADGSANAAQSQAPAPFDPLGLSMHSAHPADAGLTPAELGLAVDEHGVPLHARRHMFDELGAELLEQQAEKQKKKQQQAAGKGSSVQQLLADSKFAAPRSHLDAGTPANPHLHLCLLASLFLQRPSLPATASAASVSFVSSSKWLESTRARVAQMQAQWEALKQRHDVSLRDMESFLAHLQHVGLEIDVALQRGQRRSRSFAAIKSKLEELLWQLQKRKQTSSSASGSESAGGATVVDGMVQSDLKRANLRLQALSYNEIPLGKLMDVLQPASASSARADQALRDYRELCHLLGKHYAELANIFRHYASLGFDDGTTTSGAAASDGGAASPTAAKKNPASLSAASTLGAALSFAEFIVLARDCHLLNKKVSKGVLHTLFTRCTLTLKQLAAQSSHTMPHTDADRLEHSPLGGEELLANAAAAAKGGGIANKTALTSSSTGEDSAASFSAGGSSLHLTLSQPALFESFIRLGILKYPGVSSLPERVRRLIEMDILPHACRLRLDEFRSLLSRDRVRHVFQAHKHELQIVFAHFAKEDDVVAPPKDGTAQSAAAKAAAIAAAAKGRVINKAGFLRLAQEAKLLSTPGSSATSSSPSGSQPLFESHLSAILSAVLRVPDVLLSAQASAAVGGTGGGSTSRSSSSFDFDLSFPEFLESLGSIAAFQFPDPYLPLQVKLENWITHVLLPPLRRGIKRLNQSRNNAITNNPNAMTTTPTHGLSPTSTSSRARRLL